MTYSQDTLIHGEGAGLNLILDLILVQHAFADHLPITCPEAQTPFPYVLAPSWFINPSCNHSFEVLILEFLPCIYERYI